MSVTKKPFKKTFSDYVAPKGQGNDESLGQIFSLVSQGNFGTVYDVIRGKSVNINGQYDGKVLINTIIRVNPEQISEERKIELIEYLITYNQMYVNAYDDDDGMAPMHCAVQHDLIKILKYLISKSANINAKNMSNMTPLHYATLINLRACPKENAPRALVQREPVSNIKMTDITDQLIKLFIDGVGANPDEPVNSTNLAVNNITDGTTESELINKFAQDLMKLKDMYLMFIESYSQTYITKELIVSLMGSQQLSKQELIIKLSNYMEQNLNNIEFPAKIINTDDVEMDINCKINPEQRYREYFTENLQKFHETIITNVNKELEKKLENYEKEMIRHIDNTLPDVIKMFKKYNFVLNNDKLILLMKNVYANPRGAPTYSQIMLPHMLNELITPLTGKDGEHMEMNYVMIALPNAKFIDKNISSNDDKDEIINAYSFPTRHDNSRDPKLKFIIETFEQVLHYYNYDKIDFLKKILHLMPQDISYINIIVGEYMNEINNNNSDAMPTDIPRPRQISKKDLTGDDALENLKTAIAHKESQSDDVQKLITNIEGTILQRSFAIARLKTRGITKVLSILESKENDILGGIMTAVELYTYTKDYPLFIKDFNFSGTQMMEGENIDNYIARRIGHIEKINVDQYITNPNPINIYFESMKNQVAVSPIIRAIEHVYNHLYMNIKHSGQIDAQALIDYNKIDNDFENNYKSMPEKEIVPDIISTFMSFMLTMYTRYFIAYHGYARVGGADVKTNNPRNVASNATTSSEKIITLLCNSVINMLGVQGVRDLDHHIRKLSSVQHYIRYFDTLFAETSVDINNKYTFYNNIHNGDPAGVLDLIIPAGADITQGRIIISNKPMYINAVFLKSALSMLNVKYPKIPEENMIHVIQRFCGRIFDIGIYTMYDEILNKNHVTTYDNVDKYALKIFTPINNITSKLQHLDMSVFNAPFNTDDDPIYIQGFHNMSPVIVPLGVDDVDYIITNYSKINQLAQNDIKFSVPHDKPFNILLNIAIIIKNAITQSSTNLMTSDEVELYKNRYKLYHKTILFIELYRIMFIDNGVIHVDYFIIITKLLKEIQGMNINNLQLLISPEIINTIRQSCNIIIDEKKAKIDVLKDHIDETYKQYKNYESDFVQLNGVTRSLKKVYDANKISEELGELQTFSRLNPGPNHFIRLDKTVDGHNITYLPNKLFKIGTLTLPKYFKDIEQMSIPNEFGSTNNEIIDFDVRKIIPLTYKNAYASWKKQFGQQMLAINPDGTIRESDIVSWDNDLHKMFGENKQKIYDEIKKTKNVLDDNTNHNDTLDNITTLKNQFANKYNAYQILLQRIARSLGIDGAKLKLLDFTTIVNIDNTDDIDINKLITINNIFKGIYKEQNKINNITINNINDDRLAIIKDELQHLTRVKTIDIIFNRIDTTFPANKLMVNEKNNIATIIQPIIDDKIIFNLLKDAKINNANKLLILNDVKNVHDESKILDESLDEYKDINNIFDIHDIFNKIELVLIYHECINDLKSKYDTARVNYNADNNLGNKNKVILANKNLYAAYKINSTDKFIEYIINEYNKLCDAKIIDTHDLIETMTYNTHKIVIRETMMCNFNNNTYTNAVVEDLELTKYVKGKDLYIAYTDVLKDKDITTIVRNYYEKNIKQYQVLDVILNKITVPGLPEQKQLLITNHMQAIYEQFTVEYMRAFMKHVIHEYATNHITGNNNATNLKQFNLQVSDLAVNISTIDSDLKSYITGQPGAQMPSEKLDVKIVEDANFDIYASETNVVGTNKVHRFYSYDYFSKQSEQQCITVNTELIKLLLEKNAKTDIRDSNDMTAINYMIDAKMYYLLGEGNIKQACKQDDAIVTLVAHEQRNNGLYFDKSGIYYEQPTYALIQKFKDDYMKKLSNYEDIKNNIPVNIGYVFAMYACLQNIYWYRRMNKEFADVAGANAGANPPIILNADYNEIYTKLHTDARILSLNPNKRLLTYDWREFNTNVDLSRHSISKVEKYKTKLTRSREHSASPTEFDDAKYTELSDENLKEQHLGKDPNARRQGHDDDMFAYFNTLFERFDIPVLYSSMWKKLIDGDKSANIESKLDHNAMIHHKFHKKYTELLEGIVPDNSKMDAFDDNNMQLNTSKFEELIAGANVLDKLYEPISDFIDLMHLPMIIDSNRMLKTQVSILCHILSTVLGANMLIRCKTMLYDELKRYAGYNPGTIDQTINDITKGLKKYVTDSQLKTGNLSYDFLKAHMQFKADDEDNYEMESTDKMFLEVLSRLEILPVHGIDPNSKFMTSMVTSLGKYYHTLYKETTQTLLAYSDSYYRYIKNQHLGIKFVAGLV